MHRIRSALREDGAAVAAIALLQLAAHLFTIGLYGFHRDELYLVSCGRRLAWGSIDHAPLAPALSHLAESLFGLSPAAQRIPDALFGAATVLVAGLCARRIGGGRAAQLVAAAAVATAPIFFFAGGVHGTNSADQLCQALAGFLLLGIAAGRSGRLDWIALGIVLGAGCLDKYTVLLCAAGLFAGLLATPARAQLRTAWPWIGALVAIGIALPTVLWQAGHGWPALEFIRDSNEAARQRTPLWRIPLDLVTLLDPVGFALVVGGISAGLRRGAPPAARAAAIAFLTVLAAVLALHGKPYYVAPAATPILAIGAAAAVEWLAARTTRRTRATLVSLWMAAAVIILCGTLPVIPAALQQRLRLQILNPELIQFPDWEHHVAQIADAFHSSGLGRARNAAVLTDSYGTAAAVELLGPAHGLRRSLSGANAYFALAPQEKPEDEPDAVLALGYSQSLLASFFDEVVEVATVRSRAGLDNRFDFPRTAWLCRGRKRSLRTAWIELKRFD